ncbi:MBL fold metallo-hydrolase [Robertkochia aurantiaca]|uniref:MBL fold metallo-hydrolase n=1 Tax=Robertkochia aurantiaca TaxID=2873700 RepID=UPI001CC907E1|nr:rhodanese-like domain-containing protein [Robertkochia sp. 3YJGBD-33]
MKIQQFEDKPLAHYSYAIVSGDKIALVDPARDPKPYYRFAEEQNARIVAVFETHPHADFVSSHKQIHTETGATIYTSKMVGAAYEHLAFDDGDTLEMNEVTFSCLHTPGHSPDGITIVASDEDGTKAMFTGDTLFIGDVGRPDLREKAGNMKAKREELAKMMYNTIRTKFNELPDETLVYPAHGAGSLCGKNLSSDASSTLGNERQGNWAFKDQSEQEFVDTILADQPFIPSYFGFDVDINKNGADRFEAGIATVPYLDKVNALEKEILVVDTRDEEKYKKGHLPGSINIMARKEEDKVETWLGSIVRPEEPFYLVIDSITDRHEVLHRVAKIGYEKQVKAVVTLGDKVFEKMQPVDLEAFKKDTSSYTVLDIRNKSEVSQGKFFDHAINIPLNELRDSLDEIPKSKPVVVHCAGGYRSAAGSSILQSALKDTQVYDLSDAVEQFK